MCKSNKWKEIHCQHFHKMPTMKQTVVQDAIWYQLKSCCICFLPETIFFFLPTSCTAVSCNLQSLLVEFLKFITTLFSLSCNFSFACCGGKSLIAKDKLKLKHWTQQQNALWSGNMAECCHLLAPLLSSREKISSALFVLKLCGSTLAWDYIPIELLPTMQQS